MTGLLIDAEMRVKLHDLARRAMENPVDIVKLVEDIKIPEKKLLHKDRMTAQSLSIPTGYVVIFSIEHGQPIGPTRHMSMYLQRRGQVPDVYDLWVVAQELGFWGPTITSIDKIYVEPTPDGYHGVHLLQRVTRPDKQVLH